MIVLDGGTGTTLWALAEKNGYTREPVWKYNIEHKDIVYKVHRDYVNSGSKIIMTNTFGANISSVEQSSNYDINNVIKSAVMIAKEACLGTDCKAYLDIGPLSMLLEPYGDLTEEEAYEIFDKQIKPGVEAGAEGICFETFFDIEMMKVAIRVAKNYDVKIFASFTFQPVGKTIMGNSVSQVIEEIDSLGVDAIGLNCSLGPKSAIGILKQFKDQTNTPLFFKPNAGTPIVNERGETVFKMTAEEFADEVSGAFGIAEYIGGCCGTNPEFIKEICKKLNG